MGAVRCPRCGRKISAVLIKTIKGRKYVYIEHYLGYEGGKAKKSRCYLGPIQKVDPAILALRGAARQLTGVLTVTLTPEEVEAFRVKVLKRVGKRKYKPEEHRGLTWEQINEAWASLKAKFQALTAN